MTNLIYKKYEFYETIYIHTFLLCLLVFINFARAVLILVGNKVVDDLSKKVCF